MEEALKNVNLAIKKQDEATLLSALQCQYLGVSQVKPDHSTTYMMCMVQAYNSKQVLYIILTRLIEFQQMICSSDIVLLDHFVLFYCDKAWNSQQFLQAQHIDIHLYNILIIL